MLVNVDQVKGKWTDGFVVSKNALKVLGGSSGWVCDEDDEAIEFVFINLIDERLFFTLRLFETMTSAIER